MLSMISTLVNGQRAGRAACFNGLSRKRFRALAHRSRTLRSVMAAYRGRAAVVLAMLSAAFDPQRSSRRTDCGVAIQRADRRLRYPLDASLSNDLAPFRDLAS